MKTLKCFAKHFKCGDGNGGGDGIGDVDGDDDATVTVTATATAITINNKGSERNGGGCRGGGDGGGNGGDGGGNFGGSGGSHCSTGAIFAATISAEFLSPPPPFPPPPHGRHGQSTSGMSCNITLSSDSAHQHLPGKMLADGLPFEEIRPCVFTDS